MINIRHEEYLVIEDDVRVLALEKKNGGCKEDHVKK